MYHGIELHIRLALAARKMRLFGHGDAGFSVERAHTAVDGVKAHTVDSEHGMIEDGEQFL